jgi:hypothetical protein
MKISLIQLSEETKTHHGDFIILLALLQEGKQTYKWWTVTIKVNVKSQRTIPIKPYGAVEVSSMHS